MFQFEPKVGSIASHGKKNELEETLRAETKKKTKQPAEFIPRKQPNLLQ